MSEENRARRLGDVGRNAPSQWEWGYATSVPHLMVMFFAEAGGLEALVQSTKGEHMEATHSTSSVGSGPADLDGVEPFGFADGISQPQIDWERQRNVTRPQLDYTNVVALGEFLLGYRNEYDKYTDRPLIDAAPVRTGYSCARMLLRRRISGATERIW